MKNKERKYWIIVASHDHVKNGIYEGVAQACHGKLAPLKRMRKDDIVIFYSGKKTFGLPEKCQKFTAIGKVSDEEIYQYRMTPDFCPSRRKIDFLESKELSIIPFIDNLEFIKNKKYWGYPFRFGFFEINQHDFDIISEPMLEKTYG
ncbi:UNVERIFIED_CONTAM: hypothetical protein GTU68_067310 [Idotea baltica]|nr:hypothetical protein [Idotea baltica]